MTCECNAVLEVVKIVNEILPAYEGRPVPVLVIGDLNDEDHDASVRKLEEAGLVNTLKGFPKERRWTIAFHNFQTQEVLHQGFDHILVSPLLQDGKGIEWVKDSSKVARFDYMLRKRRINGVEYDWPVDDYSDKIGYADHLPVVTKIRVAE